MMRKFIFRWEKNFIILFSSWAAGSKKALWFKHRRDRRRRNWWNIVTDNNCRNYYISSTKENDKNTS